LEVAEAVRRYAKKDAWIVDFTNPVGIVTRALLEAGHRAVGLCNVAIGFQRRFAQMLGVDPDAVSLAHVGLNHLTWERAVYVTESGHQRDALPGLLTDHLADLADEVELPASLLTVLGTVPSYYLRYFYAHDQVLQEQLKSPTRAEAVMEVERTLLDLYADPTVDKKPEALAKRGGAFYSEAAINLIVALRSEKGDAQVVNVRNDGILPFLPDDHVIEVPALVGVNGLRPLPVDPLPADIAGLIGHVAGYERLALDAALYGGRDRVFRAMLAHPLVQQRDRAEKLTDLLLQANGRYLGWAQ
jgi:6-phospho-beta-glucosidase